MYGLGSNASRPSVPDFCTGTNAAQLVRIAAGRQGVDSHEHVLSINVLVCNQMLLETRMAFDHQQHFAQFLRGAANLREARLQCRRSPLNASRLAFFFLMFIKYQVESAFYDSRR